MELLYLYSQILLLMLLLGLLLINLTQPLPPPFFNAADVRPKAGVTLLGMEDGGDGGYVFVLSSQRM